MTKIFVALHFSEFNPDVFDYLHNQSQRGELWVGLYPDDVTIARLQPKTPCNKRVKIVGSLAFVAGVRLLESADIFPAIGEIRPTEVVVCRDFLGFDLDRLRSVLSAWNGTVTLCEDQRSLHLGNGPSTDFRRDRLKALLRSQSLVRVLEAHNGLTGLIVEKESVSAGPERREFDAMWLSSLCDSTAKGKPDIELVDMTSRLDTLHTILEVTTKPIIVDGDTGGLLEHFRFNVRTLERIGVSAVIIEDKVGLKKNSLYGTEVAQSQDDPMNFCEKIRAGKQSQVSRDFMIIARIESLILEAGMEDAMMRARLYVSAGADGIMIHSAQKDPAEILDFLKRFRAEISPDLPLVVVPTSYNAVTEVELTSAGANIVIYANHLTRSAFPAMVRTARSILTHGRSKEVEAEVMSIKEILALIPGETT